MPSTSILSPFAATPKFGASMCSSYVCVALSAIAVPGTTTRTAAKTSAKKTIGLTLPLLSPRLSVTGRLYAPSRFGRACKTACTTSTPRKEELRDVRDRSCVYGQQRACGRARRQSGGGEAHRQRDRRLQGLLPASHGRRRSLHQRLRRSVRRRPIDHRSGGVDQGEPA